MAETRRVEHVLNGRDGIPLQAVAEQLCAAKPPVVIVPPGTDPIAATEKVGQVVDAAPLEDSFDIKVVLELTDAAPVRFDLFLRSQGTPDSPTIVRAEMFPKE
jgi:hypothetical protein